MMSVDDRPDGRTLRWEQHRSDRREFLVRTALRAIREHGPTVTMDIIATEARTSKPVIYRHFHDRAGLYRGVLDNVHEYVVTNLHRQRSHSCDALDVVTQLADTYLTLVARDPHIYRFVITRPLADGPVDDPVTSIGARIADWLVDTLEPHLPGGTDTQTATTWAHGIVGCIWAITEQWFSSGMVRAQADVVADVTALFRPLLAPSSPKEPA